VLVQAVDALHERLRDYIEATYHIADPQLLRRRRRLLDEARILRQPAYVESTRVYATGRRYADLLATFSTTEKQMIGDLIQLLAGRDPALMYDPPYEHQLLAVEALLTNRNVVVFTGTGSGKTECFTIPILLRLLREAVSSPTSFAVPAVRALILYPMNALVNDQLSRIRLLLGDDDVADAFTRAAGRPARFGQYTGRTPFPGLRDFSAERDGARMKGFKDFYMDTVFRRAAAGDADANLLLQALCVRGRWPSKPQLHEWFGGTEYGSNARYWEDRLHTQPSDRELLTRHEFYGYHAPGRPGRLGAPPDLLITNYSMLEYMLLRPIERDIFQATRTWLDQHRDQRLFLVLDEAHLYRGAQGTEVALLVRRLFERLGLSETSRRDQLRIAVTSASFSSPERAVQFAAQLVGAPENTFVALGGRLQIQGGGAIGSAEQAVAFASVDLAQFYAARTAQERIEVLATVLTHLGVDVQSLDGSQPLALERALHAALETLPLRRELVARTQTEAFQVDDLAQRLFPDLDCAANRQRATEGLIALCAFARRREGGSNLLPSRIHSFHRGLPGLWICLDANCIGLEPDERGGTGGWLYAQPREHCDHCRARVLEFFTCRSCGAAYARAYATGVRAPTFVWSQGTGVPGLGGNDAERLLPLDLLLETTRALRDRTEFVDIDVTTGGLLREQPPPQVRVRRIGLYRLDDSRDERPEDNGRPFFRCGVCDDNNDETEEPSTRGGRRIRIRQSPVEDHQTSGQEPFYALVHEQLMRQPPRPEPPPYLARETPLRGRKVLIFSDGRQKAARLAAELGRSALRDSARPILLRGFHLLQGVRPRPLGAAYAALLVGAVAADVELRATDERFDLEIASHLRLARELVDSDFDQDALNELEGQTPPAPIATILLQVLKDKHTGLQALALARIVPFGAITARNVRELLPTLQLGTLDDAGKRSLLNLWLGLFLERAGCNLYAIDQLEGRARWLAGSTSSGFFEPLRPVLQAIDPRNGVNTFRSMWLPRLRPIFCEGEEPEGTLRAARIGLDLTDPIGNLDGWSRCARCSRVQGASPVPVCVHCGVSGELLPLDAEPTRGQFLARKGFYRNTVVGATEPLVAQPLVVREHSAQLTGQSGDVHNRAERYELAFQDITAGTVDGMRSVVDVLSCTTTMEVGIDIGSLSGVALRNMPPGRANYQQRAGRAGRRGSGVATVLAYADQDGHNQHFYENPQKLVKDPVPDPTLNLSNRWITRRHVNAFVLQQYLASQIPATEEPTPADANLFASLGTVAAFVNGTGRISLGGLREWLARPEERNVLIAALDRWLPTEVEGRAELIAMFDEQLLGALTNALRDDADPMAVNVDEGVGAEDVANEDNDTSSPERLLDRLLYEGVLPKYAFPTDLIAFHVFEATNGLGAGPSARNKLRYAPQRNLSIALSEYAPGKTVFIDGRAWAPGALFSPIPDALETAFQRTRYVRSCKVEGCGHTQLFDARDDGSGNVCPSCGDSQFGTGDALAWMRPPGFAHPVTWRPRTDPEYGDIARAGRAVLAAPSPPTSEWSSVTGTLGILTHLGRADDRELIVTNHGPRGLGFRVCRSCGMIEPATKSTLSGRDGHNRPEPDPRANVQPCTAPQFEIVRLGTSFRTDVLAVRFLLPPGQDISQRHPVFRMALTSLTEALATATCITLEIEPGEVLGGFRHGFTPQGPEPRAMEVFLYDQLAGGAGYVVEARERINEILDACQAILSHAAIGGRPASQPCDRACYNCLLSFKNSYEHSLFDRWLALDLLNAARTGVSASLAESRQATAYSLIADWLALIGVAALRDTAVADEEGAPIAPIVVRRDDGRVIVPALAHPFSADTPVDADLADVLANGAGLNIEVIPLNFLEVMRSLPTAMERIRERIDG